MGLGRLVVKTSQASGNDVERASDVEKRRRALAWQRATTAVIR